MSRFTELLNADGGILTPRAKVSTVTEHRITLGSYERERLNALIEAEAKKDNAQAIQGYVKAGVGGTVAVAAIGSALALGYASWSLAQWVRGVVPDWEAFIAWVRQAGPSEGLGAALNPFKEKVDEDTYYFRSTGGNFTAPVTGEDVRWTANMGKPGQHDYEQDSLTDASDIGASVPYMPQGWFESDAHYEARLALHGYTRASYKQARANSASFAPLWFGSTAT